MSKIRNVLAVCILVVAHYSNVRAESSQLCVIDMGSTNFKVLIGKMNSETGYKAPDGFNPLDETQNKRTLDVGTSLDSQNSIPVKKLQNILETLSNFKRLCEHYGSKHFYAVASSAFRDANESSKEEVRKIATNLGIKLEILTPEREAWLGYLAATGGEKNHAVIDMGSRSFQIMSIAESSKFNSVSFNLGYKETFRKHFQNVSTFKDGMMSYQLELDGQLRERLSNLLSGVHLMTIDSTATMVANFVKETGGDIDNRKLTAINLSYATEKLKTFSSEVFEAKKTTKDFDKLIYGVVLLDYLIKQGQLDGIDITNRSLAYGVMLDIEMNPTAPK